MKIINRNKKLKFEKFKQLVKSLEIFQSDFTWEFSPKNLNIGEFTTWYIENGTFLNSHYSKCFLPFLKVEEKEPRLCFKNSQSMALNNKRTSYFEGIVFRQDCNHKIHHGFNVKQKKIIDITYLFNKKKTDDEIKSKYIFYHGVNIPLWFIKEYQSDKDSLNQKPLIYEYFSYCKLMKLEHISRPSIKNK